MEIASLRILVVVVVLAVAVVFFFRRRKTSSSPPKLTNRQAEFWSRPASFSLIIFDKNVQDAIRAFLESCGYEVLESASIAGPFAELYPKIERPSGPNNEIVAKFAYLLGEHTILADPEMVVAATNPEALTAFCQAHSANATSIIWERFSETIMLEVHGPQGIISSTTVVAGVPQHNISPNPILLKAPSLQTLASILTELRIPVSTLFGPVIGIQYTLKE